MKSFLTSTVVRHRTWSLEGGVAFLAVTLFFTLNYIQKLFIACGRKTSLSQADPVVSEAWMPWPMRHVLPKSCKWLWIFWLLEGFAALMMWDSLALAVLVADLTPARKAGSHGTNCEGLSHMALAQQVPEPPVTLFL